MKQVRNFSILLAVGVMMSLFITSCGRNTVTYEPLPSEEEAVYSIAVLSDTPVNGADEDTAAALIHLGFRDALSDYFGDGHFALTEYVGAEPAELRSAADAAVLADTDLVFVSGKQALSIASRKTETIPIVGANVLNFNPYLETRTNITGVSSCPPIASQLSLLIEVSEQPKHIGIVFAEDDTDAIYQNEILETYLFEAGISYDEISLPVDGKNKNKKIRKLMRKAAADCDAFFIPANTALAESGAVKIISNIAEKNGIPTIAADQATGEMSLATIFTDPYENGYAAGRMAYRVLVNGDQPERIKIGSSSAANAVKLYQDTVADATGDYDFPKSFYEFDTYMESYVPGANVERPTAEDANE